LPAARDFTETLPKMLPGAVCAEYKKCVRNGAN